MNVAPNINFIYRILKKIFSLPVACQAHISKKVRIYCNADYEYVLRIKAGMNSLVTTR